ncbi:hypothetical protein AP3564_07240 [Aeribacillus pallidus]|uniref:Squalene cyclase C-terminal domain-containing protein n=1 Tax=Aeribacillus pallidus TaxID=33936 RepID=A0A223E473_9BACI|nr:hypothetical protein AP3564_07240 [Aeribacillus pallidus]
MMMEATGHKFILQSAEREDWTTSYPTGQAMAGGFYIHYQSYQHVFPLLTLSHYQKKFEISVNKNIISE